MTREEFAERCRLQKIMWAIGLGSPLFLLPQLLKILETKDVGSVSLLMLLILLVFQTAYGFHGFVLRQKIYVISNTLGATMTLATAVVAMHLGASW